MPEIIVPANEGSLTRTKEFTVSQWQENIRNGQRFQQKFAMSNQWNRYKEYYRHNFGHGGIIPVNLMFSLLRSMVPQVYFRNPRVTVTARRPGVQADLHARLVQTLDNWLLQELMFKKESKKLIADAFLSGIGTGFVGYDSEFGYDPRYIDPETGQFSLTQFSKRGYRLEYNSAVSPGMPWFLRARPEDVVWPWGCEGSESSPWVAMRVFRPLDDIKRDPKYSNTRNLEGTFVRKRTGPEGSTTHDLITGSGFDENLNNRPWVELWQIHDLRTGKILGLTMSHDKFLRNQEDELQIDGKLPAETLVFNPDPDYIYGVPDARIIEPQLLELNEIRTQAMKHRRVDIAKFLYKDGAIDQEELEKLTGERVMAGVKINTDATDIKNAVITFSANVSGILQDLAASGEIVRGDVREMVGFSRIAQGEFQGKTHISAEETKRVFQSLNIRLDERRDMIADMLEQVVRRFNQMIFTYWNQERVTQIVGPDGAQWWLKYTGSQIADEYNISIAPEEGTSMDSGTKFELGLRAAEVWAKMNAGAVKSGAPVPAEIQRLVFNQFQGSGLDIDRLLAQTSALSQQAQQNLQGLGQSQGAPVSPGVLAAAMGAGQ